MTQTGLREEPCAVDSQAKTDWADNSMFAPTGWESLVARVPCAKGQPRATSGIR